MTTCDLCTRDSLGLLSANLAPPAFPALLHSDQPEEHDNDNGDDDDSNDYIGHDYYDDDALLHSDQPEEDDDVDRVGGEGNAV